MDLEAADDVTLQEPGWSLEQPECPGTPHQTGRTAEATIVRVNAALVPFIASASSMLEAPRAVGLLQSSYKPISLAGIGFGRRGDSLCGNRLGRCGK